MLRGIQGWSRRAGTSEAELPPDLVGLVNAYLERKLKDERTQTMCALDALTQRFEEQLSSLRSELGLPTLAPAGTSPTSNAEAQLGGMDHNFVPAERTPSCHVGIAGVYTREVVASGVTGVSQRVSVDTNSEDSVADDNASAHRSVNAVLLDRGGMYVPKLSLWDVMLFVGHECLGPSVSCMICLSWLLNLALQSTFLVIVCRYMLEEPITDMMLQGLLQFRLGPAHSIEYADKVTHRSLASQVCGHDFKLPLAGGQEGLLGTIRDFKDGGIILCVLATFLWLMTVMQDLQETTNLVQALTSIKRRNHTTIKFVDSDHLSGNDGHYLHSRTSRTDISTDEDLVTLIKVARVTKLGRLRLAWMLLLVVVPKLVIGVAASIVGAIWLARTNVLADLVLNAMALRFVLDIDDVIFAIFVPRRARTLMANLEPLPLPARRSLTVRLPVLNPLCKMSMVLVVSLPIFMMYLVPAYEKQQRVESILCSGKKDFVYATSSATDMVYVTSSSRSTEWTYSEKAVLQATEMKSEDTWGFDDEVDEAVEQQGYDFSFLLAMSQWSVEEAASILPCQDEASAQSKEAAVRKLRDLFRDTGLTIQDGCQDVPKSFCSMRNMTQLRAICPNYCECDRSSRGAGFFETSSFGCPAQCASFKAAYNEIAFEDKSSEVSAQGCRNIRPDKLGAIGSCLDQDHDRYDAYGDDCSFYEEKSSVCTYDLWDDTDFTATILCCACGGGQTTVPVTSDNVPVSPANCFRHFTDDCYQLPQDVISWVLYVRGMWEVLTSRFAYDETVEIVAGDEVLAINLTGGAKREFIEWVTNGSLAEDIASGTWEIMRGLGHPRALEGCDFLTSHEIKRLLNVDLCFPAEDFTPLSFFCPVSCGCDESRSLSECPAACVLD